MFAPSPERQYPLSAACLRCGYLPRNPEQRFCRRCGLSFHSVPDPLFQEMPECQICYCRAEEDGRFPSAAQPWLRLGFLEHRLEHENFPVGDEEWLESLREMDRLRLGPWTAPFDLVRRYLVTGMVEAGRQRSYEHNAVVTAMLQLRGGVTHYALGDQPAWREARQAVSALRERYARGRVAPRG